MNDTSAVQDGILQYLQPSKDHNLGFPIPVTLPKDSGGMEHNVTARFLIPASIWMHLRWIQLGRKCLPAMHIADTLASTIAMFDNNNPNFQLMAEEWPTFLYDEEAGWNAEKAENGLFHGHVLTWVGVMLSPLHPAHSPFTPHFRSPSGCSKTRPLLR